MGIKKRRAAGSKADLALELSSGDHMTKAATAEGGEGGEAGEEDEEGEEEVPADWKDQLTKMLLKDTNTMKHKRFYKVRRSSSCRVCVCVCVCETSKKCTYVKAIDVLLLATEQRLLTLVRERRVWDVCDGWG